jgi:hypothetical protein
MTCAAWIGTFMPPDRPFLKLFEDERPCSAYPDRRLSPMDWGEGICTFRYALRLAAALGAIARPGTG